MLKDNFIYNQFASGAALLRGNVSLFLPVLIFLLLNKAVRMTSNTLKLNGLDTNLLEVMESVPVEFLALPFLLVLIIKASGILYTNADILMAVLRRHRGARLIISTLIFRPIISYYIFTIVWSMAFISIGSLTILSVYQLHEYSIVTRNCAIIMMFLLLLPVFYAGLSIMAFVVAARAFTNILKPFNRWRWRLIYVFYAIRSGIDLIILGVIPIVAFQMPGNVYVKVVIVFIVTFLLVSYMRSVSVIFKRRLLLG